MPSTTLSGPSRASTARGLGMRAFTALVLLFPSAAWACPMCFSAKNEAGRVAYLATTGVLTFLPLIVIGSTIVLVKRHIDKNAA